MMKTSGFFRKIFAANRGFGTEVFFQKNICSQQRFWNGGFFVFVQPTEVLERRFLSYLSERL
jgi:hypothetical protein